MPGDSAFEKFQLLVKAIEPLLDRIVVIGGWAHRMYRLRPHAQVPKHPPLMTLDADLAIPERMPASEEDIGKRLHDAGFREHLMGDHTPPVSKYTFGEEQGGFYVEFLAPLTGSRYKRGGRPDTTVRVAGVTAQKLLPGPCIRIRYPHRPHCGARIWRYTTGSCNLRRNGDNAGKLS